MSDSNIGGEASILEERRRKLDELRKANIAYVNNFIPSEKAKIYTILMVTIVKRSLKKKRS